MERLQLENVQILFKNFNGTKGQFNEAGNRNFSILIDDMDLAERLIAQGWALKPLKDDEGNTENGELKLADTEVLVPDDVVELELVDDWDVVELKLNDVVETLDKVVELKLDDVDVLELKLDVVVDENDEEVVVEV